MATDAEIKEIMKMLDEYYGIEHTTNQARIYLATLADIPGDVLEKAAFDHIAVNKWFPKVAELRQAARAIQDNAGNAIQYNDDPDGRQRDRQLYWLAMTDFNSSAELDKSKPWRWYEQRRELVNVEVPEMEAVSVS